jgi:hypothetical protein
MIMRFADRWMRSGENGIELAFHAPKPEPADAPMGQPPDDGLAEPVAQPKESARRRS